MNAASSWYGSGTFWAASGVVVAFLTGTALVVVTYLAAFPKRRLLYSMTLAAPMTDHAGGIRDDLELLQRGSRLTDPHLVEIQLAGRGRKDIASSAYDNGEPIQLDIGVPIVKMLQSTSEPETLPIPKVTTERTKLRIGPSLIGRRQRITFTLLADGLRPRLTCESPLIDVKIENRTPPPPPSDEIEWLFDQRQQIGCLTLPLMYAAVGVAWAVAGFTVAFMTL